jgi:hypothetical protein
LHTAEPGMIPWLANNCGQNGLWADSLQSLAGRVLVFGGGLCYRVISGCVLCLAAG